MNDQYDQQRYLAAVQDFRRARRQAAMHGILAQLTGQSDELLCYADVRDKLRAAEEETSRGLQQIPLDAIIGSVGRCGDFTREFLPRVDSGERRWARIRAIGDLGRLPPIHVYLIGEAYFVLDGNHRVSIARQLGATHIQGYVIEIHTRVPLSPDDRPDNLILKAEYTDFLEHTGLDLLRPGVELTVSVPGQYQIIERDIEIHRRSMDLNCDDEVPYEAAVVHWYDQVFLPVVEAIRKGGILRDFPGRTETDLYVWISRYRAELEEKLGWEVPPEEVAFDLVAQASPRTRRVVARIGDKIRETLTPDELFVSSPPGHWRQEHLLARRDDRLFCNILVAVDGGERGWGAVDQALVIARHEEAQLHGLHIIPSDEQYDDQKVAALQDEFQRRCTEAGVLGELTVEIGTILHRIGERSQWVDLVVLSLSHPPAPSLGSRLSSGLSALLRRCTRPVLTVPAPTEQLDRILLAYNDSPEAEEALFVATYLAGRWQVPLVVLTVAKSLQAAKRIQVRAQRYLEDHGVSAVFVTRTGTVGRAILEVSKEQNVNLTVLGSYRRSPMMEVMLGSTVDHMLRKNQYPLLICR